MAAAHLAGCTIAECLCDIRRYRRIFAYSLAIVALEVCGGFATGSLFLLTDAGHAFVDLVPISLAFMLARRARQCAPREIAQWEKRGGVANGALLILLMGWIAVEALKRLAAPEPVSPYMIAIAAAGACLNFRQHRLSRAVAARNAVHEGLSLHILSDLWQSLAVIAGGLLIWTTGEPRIDTALSLAVAAAFLFFGIRLIVRTLGT